MNNWINIKGQNKFYFSTDGKLVKENVEGCKFLNFIYKSFCGKILRRFFSSKICARFYSIYQDSFFSRRKILPFIKKHNINISEFEKKPSQFKSFNDFFIRKLQPEARSICQNTNTLVATADSKLLIIPDLSQKIEFFVKNETFNLEFFLQNKNLAYEYFNGTMMLFRLAPYDYHRFHFPTDCIASKSIKIPGKYESVNPIVYKSGIQPLIKNERRLVVLQTDIFSEVLCIIVGAMLVGKIHETFIPHKKYKKGSEMGYFEFGGSTIALIFKQGIIQPKEIFLKHSALGFETEVNMGQAIN
ncbi:archaetidylserine decarboxylase [Candidatus Dependentiae bacterium]